MELNDALRVPLAPSEVWDALQDLALLRASLDNCESLRRLQGGEYLLAMRCRSDRCARTITYVRTSRARTA